MRILFFSTAFPQPHDPSRSPYNLHRCEALARRHDVFVVAPVPWSRASRAARGTQALSPRLTVACPTFYYPRGVFHGTHSWFLWQSVRRVAGDVVRQFRPDVVLSYWTYPDGAVALTIAAQAGIPAVAMVGGSDVLAIDPHRLDAIGRRVHRVLSEVAAIVTVSDHLKDRICALGLPSAKVNVLPPAVDTTLFSPGDRNRSRRALGVPTDARVLLWAGRLVEVKALDVLLEALAQLLPVHAATRLYLVGEGPLRDKLVNQARTLGLADRVVFVGRETQDRLAEWYRAADLTVLTSKWEGTPNALLESHACGVPFVATAVGAVPLLAIPGVDELVPPGDAGAFARALDAGLRRSRTETPAPLGGVGGWDAAAVRLADVLASVRRSSDRFAAMPAAAPGGSGTLARDNSRYTG